MNAKATIYDYARMCKAYYKRGCEGCLLCFETNAENEWCDDFVKKFPDKANEIILNWCKEHPIKTRQSEFLKMFPNAEKLPNNVVNVSPCHVDKKLFVGLTTVDCITSKGYSCCAQCKKEYWLAEVDENE